MGSAELGGLLGTELRELPRFDEPESLQKTKRRGVGGLGDGGNFIERSFVGQVQVEHGAAPLLRSVRPRLHGAGRKLCVAVARLSASFSVPHELDMLESERDGQ